MTLNRRLDHLEAIWVRGAEPSADPPAFVRWWSVPIAFGVIRDLLAARALARWLADGEDRYAWYAALSDADRAERIAREEAAWERGDPDAEALTEPYGYGRLDADYLQRRLDHEWGLADHNRGRSPLFRRTWPEWRPGMSRAERLAFDDLLAAEGEQRCAGLIPRSAVGARASAMWSRSGGSR